MAGYGVYELTDGIEAFMEMQYAKRRGESNLDGNPGSFGTPAFPNGSFVPGTNPFVQQLGLGEGFYYFRPTSTIGSRRSNQEADTILEVIASFGREGVKPLLRTLKSTDASTRAYAEIGLVLDIEETTARQRHGRALIRLHRILVQNGLTSIPA